MMEHSLNSSSMGKEAVSEESGWTSYFQDLSSQGMMMKEQSYCLSFGGGSSLVSDASSSAAAWKKFSSSQQDNHNHHLVSCSSVKKPTSSSLPKKLCFKKTRPKQISQEDDDPLEDTASSPLNSPKVGDLNSTETISRNIDYQLASVFMVWFVMI
ncbi:hypothetical protein PIB30_031925 [Stylosanthes scabra]|uniref:Uncharacterized protein n=1 Tax=Stylosanthes scabra TaxID=79078 RepID=A0ABU6YAG1_9FABA|nr:hypothetical protein [Stylosanthes scabra]